MSEYPGSEFFNKLFLSGLKPLLFFLFTTVLSITLYNVFLKYRTEMTLFAWTEIVNYANENDIEIEFSGVAAWLMIKMGIDKALTIIIQALTFRFILKIFIR